MNSASANDIETTERAAVPPPNDSSIVNAFDNFIISVFGLALFGVLIWFSVGP